MKRSRTPLACAGGASTGSPPDAAEARQALFDHHRSGDGTNPGRRPTTIAAAPRLSIPWPQMPAL